MVDRSTVPNESHTVRSFVRALIIVAFVGLTVLTIVRVYIDPLPFWERPQSWHEVVERLPSEAKNMKGKLAVITGATSGIGLETAKALASLGANVVIGARSLPEGEAVARAIVEFARQAPTVEVAQLDLASLVSVERFAESLGKRAIDLLVLNAGLMLIPGGDVSEDGFEKMFAVNYLAHFYLTTLLLKNLASSGAARVVIVSSHGHEIFATNTTKLDLNNHLNWSKAKFASKLPVLGSLEAYGNIKAAEILFARELAKREASNRITSYALHPGFVATNLGKTRIMSPEASILETLVVALQGFGQTLVFKSIPAVKNAAQGAATTVWCALAPEVVSRSGRYFRDVHEVESSKATQDDDTARELWEWSLKMIKDARRNK